MDSETEKPCELIPLDEESQQVEVHVNVKPQTKTIYKHFPIFMISCSILQVLLYYFVSEDNLQSIFRMDPHRRHEIWRFLTVLLVHVGPDHLWENVVVQLLAGVPLEMIHSWVRTSIVYLGSIFGGSLCISLYTPHTYGAGASAGFYGLTFAHFADLIINWTETQNKGRRLIYPLAIFAYTIASSIVMEFVWEIPLHHVGHAGGSATGFLLSILVFKKGVKKPWEKKLQIYCAAILAHFTLFVLLVHIFFPEYFTESHYDTNYKESYIAWVYKNFHSKTDKINF